MPEQPNLTASPAEPAVPQQPDTQAEPAPQDAPLSMEDFTTEAPTDFAPVTDAPGETETPEESATPEGETEVAPAPEAPPTETPKANKRDYSKFPEALQPKLRQMSNAAFEEYSKTFDELAATKQKLTELETKQADPNKLPDNYYEHEDGYTLSPQYKEASQQLSRISQEAQFVEQQLAAIGNSEKFFLPLWVDGQIVPGAVVAGKLVPATGDTPGIEPTRDWERKLERALSNADRLKGETVGKITALQQQFQQEHKAAVQQVEDGIKQLAPWASKPEDPITQWAENYRLKAIPKTYQSHPLAKATAHATAFALKMQQERDAMKKEVLALKNLKADAKRTPPVPSRGKQPASSSNQSYTLEQLREMA